MNTDKIKVALADPKAPWYGSDLVGWVADLLEEHERLKKEKQFLMNLTQIRSETELQQTIKRSLKGQNEKKKGE